MNHINPKLKIAIPAALVVVIGGYFGLSSYASSKAEQSIRDFLYDNHLEDSVSWKSVSSSPLGGTVTLKGVEFEQSGLFAAELKADKIVINDFINKDGRTRAQVKVSKLDVMDADSKFGKLVHTELFGDILAGSGQTQLQPQNLSVKIDFQEKQSTAALSLKLDIPNLFAVESALELDNVRKPESLLYLTSAHPALSFLPSIPGQWGNNDADGMQNIQLQHLSFSYRDQGYLQRANLLEQRYNMPFTPVVEDNSKAREKAFEQNYQEILKNCNSEFRDVHPDASKGCKAVVGTWMSKEKGFKFSLDPKSRVRIQDFERLTGSSRETRRFIERLNLKISSL